VAILLLVAGLVTAAIIVKQRKAKKQAVQITSPSHIKEYIV
jgi:hypothetical protein